MRGLGLLVLPMLVGACELLASIPNANTRTGDGSVDPLDDGADDDGAVFVGECTDSTGCTNLAEPVCALPQGDCRLCLADAECPTNVCLADGTCASDTRFIYAAPAGTGVACSLAAACAIDTAVTQLTGTKDIVKLAPGIYERSEALSIAASGTIAGPGATIRIIDGSTAYALNINPGSAMTLHGLTIDGGTPSAGNGVVFGNGCASLTLFRATTTGGGVGIFTTCPIVIRNSTMTGSNAYTLYASGTSIDIANSFIVNNVVDTTYAGPAVLLNNATGQIVHSTLAYNTSASGGAISCATSPITIKNIIATQNASDGISPDCTVSNSIVDGQFAGAGANNMRVDPLFMDVANRNYHILPGSPAAGLGDPTVIIPRDVDGDVRPTPAGNPDSGADEIP